MDMDNRIKQFFTFLLIVYMAQLSMLMAVEPQYIANFPPGKRQNIPPRTQLSTNSITSASGRLNEGTRTLLEEPEEINLIPEIKLSLKKAISMVTDENPSISEAEYEIKMARRDKRAAGAARMPVFSIQAMAKDTNVGDRWLEFGELGEAIRDINADSAAIGGIGMEVPIYLGGLLDSSERMAAHGEEIAILNKKRVVQQTLFNVILSYLDVLVEKNAVKLEDSKYDQKMNEINTAREKASERFALKQQVLALELNANEIRQDRLRHQNRLKIAQNRLLNELGIKAGTPIDISPRVGISDITISENIAIDTAVKNNFNLKILLEQTALAREQINIAASDEKTKINFNWAYFHTYPFDNPDNQYDEWEAKLQGKINIFDGGRARHKRVKEIQNLRKEEVRLKSATQEVELKVREAFFQYKEAKKLLKSLDDNIALAREMLRFVDERVSARVLLKDALLKAQVDLLETQQAKFAVHATLLKARSAIFLLTGELTMDKVAG